MGTFRKQHKPFQRLAPLALAILPQGCAAAGLAVKPARKNHYRRSQSMKLQSACLVLGAALAFTAPAWAQSKAITPTSTGVETSPTGTGTHQTSTGTGTQTMTTGTGTETGTGTGTRTTTTSTGAFQNLSPGGQRIAQSLFNSQHPPSGTQPRTLDQIAAMKGREGWGRVFKEMKADGLVQAKNLGQVVSGHAQTGSMSASTGVTSSGRQTSTRSGGRTSTVTSGSGRSMHFASGGAHGGGRYASGYSAHYMAGPGMHAGGMQGGPGFQGGGGGGFHGGGGGGGHGHGH
jgi:hypothetical protein